LRVFDFNRAIVRKPGRSVVDGLREDRGAVPDYAKVLSEHAAYVAALRGAGVKVEILPPLEAYPDSVFVEDPALVLPEGAILLRPGAATRRGEADAMRATLARHFERVLELDDEDGFADGGDVLVTPDVVFIGLSARTNDAGARSLRDKLAALGRKARIAETPKGILHFKTAVSLLNEDTLFAAPRMAASDVFSGFKILVTPDGEDAAANALRMNDTVFVGTHFPRSAELLSKEGFAVQALHATEIAKLDAGLSCMSLRWMAG
jgi:dimethylargininase